MSAVRVGGRWWRLRGIKAVLKTRIWRAAPLLHTTELRTLYAAMTECAVCRYRSGPRRDITASARYLPFTHSLLAGRQAVADLGGAKCNKEQRRRDR